MTVGACTCNTLYPTGTYLGSGQWCDITEETIFGANNDQIVEVTVEQVKLKIRSAARSRSKTTTADLLFLGLSLSFSSPCPIWSSREHGMCSTALPRWLLGIGSRPQDAYRCFAWPELIVFRFYICYLLRSTTSLCRRLFDCTCQKKVIMAEYMRS